MRLMAGVGSTPKIAGNSLLRSRRVVGVSKLEKKFRVYRVSLNSSSDFIVRFCR